MSQHERLFTHWLSGRPVWLAMFALTLLSTAYTIVVMMYSGSGLVWSPAKPLIVFLTWGALQTCFALICLLKLRHERHLRAALLDQERAHAEATAGADTAAGRHAQRMCARSDHRGPYE